MEEVRSGADFSGSEPSIPMMDADFFHGSPNSVEVGPKLPIVKAILDQDRAI